MTSTILAEIIARKRVRIEESKRTVDLDWLIHRALHARQSRRHFATAISRRGGINIIAEYKRASPSKGVINESLDPVPASLMYKTGGACAISVCSAFNCAITAASSAASSILGSWNSSARTR